MSVRLSQRSRSDRWTVLQVLDWTADRFADAGIESPRVDAEVLLAHCLGVERIRLYMDFDKPLHQEERARFRPAVKRRLGREPVAYIVGKREFWSLSLSVNRDVLVPRPETELLVEKALERIPDGEPKVVVDVGTGSGAVALAIAKEKPDARVHATDTCPGALTVARKNADQHEAEVTFHQGDLLEALPPDIRPDIIVSNPPYIAEAELEALEPEVRQWEPRQALAGGKDGLDLIRTLVSQAAQRLLPGGHLLLEIGHTQGESVSNLLKQKGFEAVEVHLDLAEKPRVVSGRRG